MGLGMGARRDRRRSERVILRHGHTEIRLGPNRRAAPACHVSQICHSWVSQSSCVSVMGLYARGTVSKGAYPRVYVYVCHVGTCARAREVGGWGHGGTCSRAALAFVSP